jgi:hypothetical protein
VLKAIFAVMEQIFAPINATSSNNEFLRRLHANILEILRLNGLLKLVNHANDSLADFPGVHCLAAAVVRG